MSAKELVFGAAVKMYKGEDHKVLKHNVAAAMIQEEFEDSLRCTKKDMSEAAIAQRAKNCKKSLKSYHKMRRNP